MPDIAKVKRNISKMIEQGAPESEIDAYVASEGASLEALQGKPQKTTQSEEEAFLQGIEPKTQVQEAGRRSGIGILRGLADMASAPYNLVQGAAKGEFSPGDILSNPVGVGTVTAGRLAGRMTPAGARSLDEAALARGVPSPAGRMVSPEEAGGVIRPTVEASPVPVRGLAGAETNEAAFERLRNLATSSNPEDIKVIHRLRASVPKEEWSKVQTAVIGPTEDPEAWMASYGSLSKAGKKAVFPDEELTRHLDSFADVTRRSAKWAELEEARKSKSGLETWLRRGTSAPAIAAAAVVSPAHALGMIVGRQVLNRVFSEAPQAAAAAKWARTYEGLVRRPSPATLSAYNIATRELGYNLDVDIDPKEAIKAAGVAIHIPGYTEALAGGPRAPEEQGPPQPLDEQGVARAYGRILGMGSF